MRDPIALTQLMQKKCKSADETVGILLEIDRMKKRTIESGGTVDDDVLVTTLWATMDPQTRTHVSSQLDMESLKYVDLRQAAMTFTNLVTSTTRGSAVPMDIGALGGGAIPGIADPDGESDREHSQVLWSLDEAGWPIDEEGWPIEGQFLEQA